MTLLEWLQFQNSTKAEDLIFELTRLTSGCSPLNINELKNYIQMYSSYFFQYMLHFPFLFMGKENLKHQIVGKSIRVKVNTRKVLKITRFLSQLLQIKWFSVDCLG